MFRKFRLSGHNSEATKDLYSWLRSTCTAGCHVRIVAKVTFRGARCFDLTRFPESSRTGSMGFSFNRLKGAITFKDDLMLWRGGGKVHQQSGARQVSWKRPAGRLLRCQ